MGYWDPDKTNDPAKKGYLGIVNNKNFVLFYMFEENIE